MPEDEKSPLENLRDALRLDVIRYGKENLHGQRFKMLKVDAYLDVMDALDNNGECPAPDETAARAAHAQGLALIREYMLLGSGHDVHDYQFDLTETDRRAVSDDHRRELLDTMRSFQDGEE